MGDRFHGMARRAKGSGLNRGVRFGAPIPRSPPCDKGDNGVHRGRGTEGSNPSPSSVGIGSAQSPAEPVCTCSMSTATPRRHCRGTPGRARASGSPLGTAPEQQNWGSKSGSLSAQCDAPFVSSARWVAPVPHSLTQSDQLGIDFWEQIGYIPSAMARHKIIKASVWMRKIGE